MSGVFAHPAFPLVAAALLVCVVSGPMRAIIAIAAPLAGLWMAWEAPQGVIWQATFGGMAVVPAVVDPLSRLFALVFLGAAGVGALFANGQSSRVELPAALLYAAAAVGVALAGDLISLFICWELMALASTLVIVSMPGPRASAAGLRYLIIHLAGGMLLLIGIAGHYLDTGTLALHGMSLERMPDLFILAAVLVNAAAWPLSSWVPDAYPEASWSGAVFLSAFTTKAAVYLLMRLFSGADLLVGAGLAMVVYGLVYALREDDLRRLIAYAIVNQVGMMVAAIGIGTDLGINAAAAHAFNHVVYGCLLFMVAGAVMFATGRRRLSELGGLYRSMPHTTIYAFIAVMTMAAFPFTSGFVAKSMIPQAAAEAHLFGVWVLMQAASGGAFLVGLRFLWFVFFGADSGLRPSDPPLDMRLAMAVLAAVAIAVGLVPELLYRLLPLPTDYVPYTGWHVVAQIQLLAFSGLAFFVFARWLGRERGRSQDVDWLYREAAPAVLRAIGAWGSAVAARFSAAIGALWIAFATWLRVVHGTEGTLGRTWPLRSMGMAMMVLLVGTLALAYVGWLAT